MSDVIDARTDRLVAILNELAGMSPDAVSDVLTFAEDEASNRGLRGAAMLADGMRAGIAQAHAADAGRCVVAFWFDDNGARATWEFPCGDVSDDLVRKLEGALSSMFRPGESG